MTNNIKELRIGAGLTQEKLADLAGISKRAIEEWEANRKPPTDVYKLYRISKVLNCSIESLINFEEE
jgi:transcriptional regulator with XRE-family HTH domain